MPGIADILDRLKSLPASLAGKASRLSLPRPRLRLPKPRLPRNPGAILRRFPGKTVRFAAREMTRARGVGVVLGLLLFALVSWLDETTPEPDRLIEDRIQKVRVAVTALDGTTEADGGDTDGRNGTDGPQGDGRTQAIAPNAAVEMAEAPTIGLYEESEVGLLPRVGPDGRQAWNVYARPFPRDTTRGLVAIVISHMGLSGATTQPVLERLPAAVTLAFKPYSPLLATWHETARSRGHETLLMVPMEPFGYPQNDPGPHSLLTFLKPNENMTRLLRALGQTTGYVGVTSVSGSRFGATPSQLRPILQMLKDRGLLFLDSAAAPGYRAAQTAAEVSMAWAYVDRVIDRDPGRAAIDAELDALVMRARETGAAVGRGEPYPTTIERLAIWIPKLPDLGLALAPVSAVVGRQRLSDRVASAG